MYIPIPLKSKSSPSSLFNLISDCNWEDAASRVKYFPKEAKQSVKVCTNGTDQTKVLPLHHACTLNPTVEITETLLRINPSAASKRDSLFKRLPLHLACLNGASSDVVRELLIAFKDGAQSKLKDGQLPLHYACGSGASREVVSELLKAYPNGARCQDNNGWLPIHLACLQNASSDVIQLLLEIYPESVSIRTSRGNTPIQCLKSIRNTGANIDKSMAMLRGTEMNLNRRPLSRCVSSSKLQDLSSYSKLPIDIPIRKRCNSSP